MVIASILTHATTVSSTSCSFTASYSYITIALFLTFLPIPVVLLTDKDGSQNVHIAPEAFSVASTEFADEIQVWQNALSGPLKGQLSTVSPTRTKFKQMLIILPSFPELKCSPLTAQTPSTLLTRMRKLLAPSSRLAHARMGESS